MKLSVSVLMVQSNSILGLRCMTLVRCKYCACFCFSTQNVNISLFVSIFVDAMLYWVVFGLTWFKYNVCVLCCFFFHVRSCVTLFLVVKKQQLPTFYLHGHIYIFIDKNTSNSEPPMTVHIYIFYWTCVFFICAHYKLNNVDHCGAYFTHPSINMLWNIYKGLFRLYSRS